MKIKDKVLIVEDEQSISNFISMILTANGFDTIIVRTGEEALTMIASHCPDMIVLDLGLPDMDGVKVVESVRAWSGMPIIVVSARSEDADKLMGFACGADDYVTKPFNILELKARIKALLRRAGGPSRAGRSPALLTVGDLSLDTEQRVALRDGRTIDLTAKEYDLIELLMKNPRRVYSRENLMNVVWGYEYVGDYRTVDVHIRRLREKLELDPANPEYIRTKWGVGYYLSGQKNS